MTEPYTLPFPPVLTVDVSPEALTVTEGETVSFLVSGGGATLQRDVVISLSSSSQCDP